MMTFLKSDGLVYAVNDPELRYTQAKTAVVSFSIAASRKWTDDGGSQHEESCFIDVTAWNKLAEWISKNVAKGDPLYVEGLLKQETWGKDGAKRSKHVLTLTRCASLKPREPGEDKA